MGTCPYQCLETSKTECGIQYSTARQSYFCAIPRPSSWPAVLQVPTEPNRAEPWRPDPVLLHTGQDRDSAERIAANLLPKPAATAGTFRAIKEYLDAWNKTGGVNATQVPGEVLNMMGLTLGTSARILAGIYIENALVREQVSKGEGEM